MHTFSTVLRRRHFPRIESCTFKLTCASWLKCGVIFRNSGHIQQSRAEAISLRAGEGFLCIASTARTFTYRPIYSRTRAYQTWPAVELVSGEEGLSLSRPLRPHFQCDVPGGGDYGRGWSTWPAGSATSFLCVHGQDLPVVCKGPWPTSGGSRGDGQWRLNIAFVLAFLDVHVFTFCRSLFPVQTRSTERKLRD